MRRWLPETFAPLSIPIEYGLPLVHVTETVVLPVIADETSMVPAFEPKSSVVAFTVQEAVIVIWTVMFAVAVPAWAAVS